MRAELKEMFSPDLASPLQDYWPETEGNFGFSLRLMIGPEGSDAAESFDVFVCTPDWLKQEHADEKYVWGRHMLIVLEYDAALIKRAVERHVSRCLGTDWSEIARRLSRFGAWEFEDYQPDS
ncbi:immunity 8 family protein [Deinococcus sp. YIM 134068]|uniref:immunity 8 family protein n=1 Tax=Deinococcus lichenicola TaxID=3118910 RepID=UPI002F93B880